MFLSPYQTTACSSYDVKGIQSALQRAEIHNDLAPAVTLKESVLKEVYIVPPYVTDIKGFPMPLEFQTPNGVRVAVDVRGFTKTTGVTSYKIQAGGEYEGAVLRAALTKSWLDGGSEEMRRWNDLPARVFLRLLCENITRVMNLGPVDQQAVYVTCGVFYYSNFIDTKSSVLEEEEKERIAVAVHRITKINPMTIAEFLKGEIPAITSLDTFCDALRAITQNPRMEKINAATIITMMGGVWFGANARQVVAVALEYPPVWLALIYQALTDYSFHGSRLTKMVDTENRNGAGAQFIRDVGSHLEIISDE